MYKVLFFLLCSQFAHGQVISKFPELGLQPIDVSASPFATYFSESLPGEPQTDQVLMNILRSQNVGSLNPYKPVLLFSEWTNDAEKLKKIAETQILAKNLGLDILTLKAFLEELVSEKLAITLKAIHMSLGIGHHGNSWHCDPIGLRSFTVVWPLGEGSTGVLYRLSQDGAKFSSNLPTIHNTHIEHSHGSGSRLRVWFD